MLCFQTHAWRQLPNQIKQRGEEKTADPSYLQAMNAKRETSDGPASCRAAESPTFPSTWPPRREQSQDMGGRGPRTAGVVGVLSGRGRMAQASDIAWIKIYFAVPWRRLTESECATHSL